MTFFVQPAWPGCLPGLTCVTALWHLLTSVCLLCPQTQLRAFYQYHLERETQLEDNDILLGLTDSLRSQLTLYTY